ncbi:hypothetical protein [Mastigocladopsis repens]|uniref:hypothetical protein n=1 Tax=Mastigocladopsis repens TaxID=221287 RepID=UPI0002D2FD0C|nr:hypothetical protein [Mastigocladopsis repens]
MFKRVLLLLCCSIGGIGAVLFFFWQQAIQLPKWYTNPPTTASPPAISDQTQTQIQLSQQQIQQQVLSKISDNLKGSNAKGEVQLDANEVNTLIVSGIAKTTDKSRLAQAVVSTNTQIKDGKISAGAVIDLRTVSLNELQAGEQAAISKLLSTVPILKYHPIYVEIEGKPNIRNKQVSLDDKTRIKFGNLSFSISDIYQRFGISQESLQQQVSKELKNLPVEVQDVEVIGDRLVVRSSVADDKKKGSGSRG